MSLQASIINEFESVFGPGKIKLDEPLKKHSYMKVGGNADLLIEATSKDQLIEAYRLGLKHKLPVFILGGGSNVIISDHGIKGLVIKNRADQIKITNFQGGVRNKKVSLSDAILEADSGVITNHLVRYTIEEGLAGLEYFLGVPGTVGGAIYNNSHYQAELFGDTVKEVDVIDDQGKLKTYTTSQMRFSYDYSLIQKTKELVVSVRFALKGGNKTKLWDKASSFAKKRAQTQPLSQPSSGCMFKNIPESQSRLLGLEENITSAGYLIDKAGLKGIRVGNAAVSDKHANFIVNLGNASSEDVKNLTKQIQKTIKKKFGIKLETEVFFIGD